MFFHRHRLTKIIVSLSLFSAFLVTGQSALAVTAPTTPTTKQSAQVATPLEKNLQGLGKALGLPETDPRLIAARLIRSALSLLGVIFVIMVLYGGLLWMTSGGDDEKVSKARRALLDAVVGLIIILSANSIVTFVVNALLGPATYASTETSPRL